MLAQRVDFWEAKWMYEIFIFFSPFADLDFKSQKPTLEGGSLAEGMKEEHQDGEIQNSNAKPAAEGENEDAASETSFITGK